MVRMLAVGALVVGRGAAAVKSLIRPEISSTYAFSFINQLQTGQVAAVWLQSLNLPPLVNLALTICRPGRLDRCAGRV